MRIEQLRFLPNIFIATKDFVQIKTRKHDGCVGKEERELSAHMSLVLSIWRLEMGLPLWVIVENNTHAVWGAIRRWISVYDDIIDRDRNDYPSREELKHYPLLNGSRASDVTSDLVEIVRTIADPVKRKRIFTVLIEFREREYSLNLELSRELQKNPQQFNGEIEKLKLESSGLTTICLTRVVNILNGIEGDKACLCERGFDRLGTSGQYVDDLGDFDRDKGDPTNLIVNASKLFPNEHSFLSKHGFTRRSLRQCQHTLDYVGQAHKQLTKGIPDQMVHTRRTAEFFADLIPLYAAFETKQYA